MSKIRNSKTFKKSQSQPIIVEEQTIQSKFKKKKDEEKKQENQSKTQEKAESKPIKSSFFSGVSGFFSKSPEIDLKKEPLGNYYQDRKKILFGNIDINKEEYYISQFLLKSQKKINSEHLKMSTGSSFFFDVPQKVYNFTLGMKENISNFCLIIRLYLFYNNKEKANEIYLLMCKQNKKILEFIYNKINVYCKKASPAMLRFTPFISKMFIQILSCLIKLSGKFCKVTLQNTFFLLYLKTIYILTLREIHKINLLTFKNDLKYHRLYFYSSCLFDSSIFNFYRYQPLSISTYILRHILELYQDKNINDISRFEQVLLLKANYNLGLFFYVDGINNEAINHLIIAKERLSDIVFVPVYIKNTEKDFIENGGRNSAIFQEKNILNKLTFYKGKINEIDEKSIDNLILNNLSKKSYNQNNNLKVINEENNNELEKKQTTSGPRRSSSLFFGIKRIELKQPLLFDHIKKKISLEIELLLSQIELNRKNYNGAFEHINIILKSLKPKDDFETDAISRKKTYNIFNKTFKNLKSFQGIKIKKLNINNFGKNSNFSKIENDKDNNKEADNESFIDDSILTEDDSKLIRFLLERIDYGYNEQLRIEQSNNSLLKKRNSYYDFSQKQTKNINYSNFKEMEKFFMFICDLSIFQLKILNESQPEFYSKRNDLPIIFSNQFKDCLTLSQRLTLSKLETMSLSRYIILIDSNKDICPENLDYKYMKYKIKTSNEKKEEIFLKFISDERRKTLNGRRSNDSMMMNTLSTNNNNTLSVKRTIKKEKEVEFEEENTMFDILLAKIKNEKNTKFIETHKKCILEILNNLNDDDKKLFQNFPILLKKMLKNIEKEIKKKKNIVNKNSSYTENSSYSFISSQDQDIK